MGAGVSSLGLFQKQVGGGGPPFPATAADNGLSVDPISGHIVLGNDIGGAAAQLLSDREIPTNQQEIYFRGGANEYVAIRGTTSGAPAMLVDVRIDRNTNANTFLGQNVNAGGSALAFSQLYNDVFRGLTYGVTSSAYSLGDYPTNQVLIYANDTVAGGASLALLANAGFYFCPAGQLLTDAAMRIFQAGNVRLQPGGVLADSGEQLQVATGGKQAAFYNLLGNKFFNIDASGKFYQIGDINGSANGSSLSIDDTGQFFEFNNTVAGLVRFNPTAGLIRIFKPGVNNTLQLIDSSGTDGGQITAQGGTLILAQIGGGYVTIGGAGVRTNDPGSGVDTWRLGKVITAASALDATKYVEISIGGVVVKLATIT